MFKMLVATDGSDYANKAVDYAGSLAGRMQDAEMTLISVLDIGVVSQTAVSPAGMPVTIPVTLVSEMERALASVLQETQDRLVSTGRRVTTRLEEGHPAQVICEIAEKEGFDLIIMGSSGHGRVTDIFLGSTSDKVIHKSRVPVLIVRSTETHGG